MAKKKENFRDKDFKRNKLEKSSLLMKRTKYSIYAILFFLTGIILTLSFFDKSGLAGERFKKLFLLIVGEMTFALPLFCLIGGLVFLSSKLKRKTPLFLGIFVITIGICAILGSGNLKEMKGGWLGLISQPLLKFFGPIVTNIISVTIILVGFLIIFQFLQRERIIVFKFPKKEKFLTLPPQKVQKVQVKEIPETKKDFKIFSPFHLRKSEESKVKTKTSLPEKKLLPPLDLLEKDRGNPIAGNIKRNIEIIRRTLQNFGIPAEMGEVNIGSTVTQYTLRPAPGVKLSKITTLSNNLSLALAAHPIRIEAPIPGKSLVGIEIPNSTRSLVRMRELISNSTFQNSSSPLTFCLGRDVAGSPLYADLGQMPHLLVAGATGTGKTTAADTLMFTEKGMLTFEELCPLSLNSEVDFKIKLVTRDGVEKTAKNYNNGICQFYKLATKRGYQIEATTEHPLWVINKDGSQSWKPASLIKKGDYVAISRGPTLFGNKVDLANFKPSEIKTYHRKISFPSQMTPQLAQFLGLLTADGCLSIERRGIHRVVYSQANPKLLSLYKKLLKKLFGISQFTEKRSGSNPNNKAEDIIVNSIHLKEFFTYLGMNSVKSPKKEIPKAIRESPKEIVASYLKALFDNDGYVEKESVNLCISSKKLASQVHIMLLNFGIISSLSIKKVKNYADNEYYKLSIYGEEARKFVQEVGFIRKEKYNKTKWFLELSSNPNVDLIPHVSSLVKRLGQKYLNRFARLTNKGWQYQSGILVPKYAFSSLRAYNSGFRAPGYQSLKKILDFYQLISQEPEYRELEKISRRNFYWDKIEKIERTSGVGYDFYVPGSDSFVGNGFVNHNTIFLNNLILSLLYKNSPRDLRFVLVDPKRVEFLVYSDIPHLLCPVIFEPSKTINAVSWLIGEMERRFKQIAEARTRDILGYNKKYPQDSLPYIILIIDELADLMVARGREIEVGIVRLAQLARAVGIHLVVATQRPSVEVITGLIKANITSRISFQVASQVDSRTVLDMAGAEKLLGLGDMLFVSAKNPKPKRIQAPFVSEKELKNVTDFIKKNIKSKQGAINEITESLKEELEMPSLNSVKTFLNGDDPLYEEAKKVVVEARKASASLLQRRLRIGYARAARLLDILEKRGVVGPGEGAKPRKVYIKEEEYQDDLNDET